MLRSLTNLLLAMLALFNTINASFSTPTNVNSTPDALLEGTFNVSGIITDYGNGLPLSEVTVTIKPGDLTAVTDVYGVYTVSVPFPGVYSVTPSLAGYTFTPDYREYTNLQSDQANQDYTATAITYSISGNVGMGGVTLSYTDGILKTATSELDGSYSFMVSYNWSGTVIPSKPGFTFTPADHTYTDVLANQANQDYTATVITYTISGNAGTGGVTLSYTDGNPKTITSELDGSYSFIVSYNWSGTVIPSLAGYSFTPVQRDYTNVQANQANQDYTATAITYTISGNAGTGGVTLNYTDGILKTATSELDGSYSFMVSYNWSGSVIPSKPGFTFTPADRTYTDVQANQANQDYTATAITYTISGNAGTGGVTLSYTEGNPKTITSELDGSYSFTVTYNWSGTVTPSKPGFAFAPAYRSYTNVLEDQTGQNYNAAIVYTIAGNAGTGGVTLSYTDGILKTATSELDGSYSFTVSYNWSGSVIPSKPGFTFTPADRTYTDVLANQANQDYTATVITYTISGNVGMGGVTLSYTDGNPKTITSELDGSYSFTVSYNWSGTVIPSLAGYSFTPVQRDYTNVQANQANQDYTATAITYMISGNAGTGGVTLSYTDGNLKTATSELDGSYSFMVSYNWSGSVIPSKPGFTFTPADCTYTDVLEDQTGQNYTATIVYTIAGNAGIAGVTLSYTDGSPKTAISGQDGSYILTVPHNWSGNVTPSKSGLSFAPSSRSYTNVQANQIDQNFAVDHYFTFLSAIYKPPVPPIFYDNFNDSDHGWLPMITPGGEAGITNGFYRLYHSKANQFLVSLAPVTANQIPTAGYILEATLTLVQGDNSCLGLVFDWQGSDSYQLLLIQPMTQNYWVYKWNGMYPYQLITSGNTAAIKPGLGSANTVKLVRDASKVQVLINSTPVTGPISDLKASNVQVGLNLSVYSSVPGEGRFDDFRISRLP